MPKFKKGELIKFTFIFFNPKMVSDTVWDGKSEMAGRIGTGVIVGVQFRFRQLFYEVKVLIPDDWRGGNNLGGKLSGDDRGRGIYLDEAAVRPLKNVTSCATQASEALRVPEKKNEKLRLMDFFGKEPPNPSAPVCPRCHTAMKELFGLSFFCPNGCDEKPNDCGKEAEPPTDLYI